MGDFEIKFETKKNKENLDSRALNFFFKLNFIIITFDYNVEIFIIFK